MASPEPEATSEPRVTSMANNLSSILRSSPEPPKQQPKGEPVPEWTHATEIWKGAWPAHWIGLTVVFFLLALLALYTLISIIRRQRRNLGILKFSMTILVIVIILSLSRSLYLLINPYESNDCIFSINQCPVFLNRFLFGLAMPSLISAYLLLYLALAEVTKIKGRGISRLQNWKFLVGIVSTNYVLSLTVELVVVYFTETKLLVVICHTYFILLAVILVVAYAHGGIQIMRDSRENRRELEKIAKQRGFENSFETHEYQGPKPPDLTKVIILTVVTSCLGLTFLACQVYALAAVYLEHADVVTNTEPWPWYAYQTVYRIDEFLMGCLLYFTVTYKASTSRRRLESAGAKFASASRSFKKVFQPSRKETLKTTTDNSVSVTVELVRKDVIKDPEQKCEINEDSHE